MASTGSHLPKKLERVQKAVQQLPTVAASLNAATDKLGDSVGKLDALLKKFNLGVPTWVPFVKNKGEDGEYSEDLGYAKVNGKWGSAIRTSQEDYHNPDYDREEKWLFNDAPRVQRIDAVEKIPELLEALLEKAAEAAKTIAEKAGEVDALTEAMRTLLAQPLKSSGKKQPIEPEW
jgi:hypothetical protein